MIALHRKLHALTGQSASLFIRSIRLQRAAALLKQDAGNVPEIAYMVGFSSQPYFTKCFQEDLGVSSKEFARQGLAKSAVAFYGKFSYPLSLPRPCQNPHHVVLQESF